MNPYNGVMGGQKSLAGDISGDALQGQQVIFEGIHKYITLMKREIVDALALCECGTSLTRHESVVGIVVDDGTTFH